ncbi:unnamed protein product [Auanema sp. JU1783]|nr:unnamed protein product [Auanema sp. JU1783]
MIVGDNLFTHTWSLAVEIQFYLIVPFIYLSERILGTPKSAILIPGISACSLAFYLWAHQDISFNFVVARLWQFLSGYLAYLKTYAENETVPVVKVVPTDIAMENISEKVEATAEVEDQKSKSNQLKVNIFVATLFVLIALLGFVPLQTLHKDVLRLVMTILASLFVYIGLKSTLNFGLLAPFWYLGDVSYILYLVHYPVYVYLNLNFKLELYWRAAGIIASFVMAVIIHESYEKTYLRLKKKFIFALITLLYIGCISIRIFNPQIQAFLYGKEINYKDVIAHPTEYSITEITNVNIQFNGADSPNMMFSECDYEDGEGPFGYCHMKGNPKSNRTAMIIGNSYAPNLVKNFYAGCHNKFKNITMLTTSGCESLWDTDADFCVGDLQDRLDAVKQYSPDYLFILERNMHAMPVGPRNLTDENRRVKIIKSYIDHYQKYVKTKIFILDAFPRPPKSIAKRVNAALQQQQRTNNLFKRQLTDGDHPNWRSMRKIFRKILRHCPKCHLMDIMPYLRTKENVFNFYDPQSGLIYFSNALHLTAYGNDKVSPLFPKTCDTSL